MVWPWQDGHRQRDHHNQLRIAGGGQFEGQDGKLDVRVLSVLGMVLEATL